MYESILDAVRSLEFVTISSLEPWLDIVWKSTLVLTIAFVFAIGARRRSAAQRHLAWTLAIVATLAMPLLAAFGPKVEVPFVSSALQHLDTAPTAPAAPAATAATGAGWSVAPPPPRASIVGPASAAPSSQGVIGSGRNRSMSAALGASAPGPSGAVVAGAPAGERGGSGLPFGAIAGLIWVAGALGVLARLALGMIRLAGVEAGASRITGGPIVDETVRVARRLGLRRMPTLLRGERTVVPMTWGLLRARLLLPAGVESWEPSTREAVLLHELGHVRRCDYLAQMAADVACALYWFHPLVWVAAHRMRVEREHACDDLVVTAGHEPARYADELVRLARRFRSAPSGAAALAFARPNRLKDRLLALLDQTRSRRPLTGRGAVALGIGAFAMAVLVAGLTPVGSAVASTSDTATTPQAIEGDSPRVRAIESGPVESSPAPLRQPVLERSSNPAPEIRFTQTVQQATVLCGPEDGEARRRSSQTNNDLRIVEAEYGECRSLIRIEGEIEFTRDFSSFARLGSGSLVRFEVERGGTERRLDVRPGAGGTPEYSWSIDGRDQPFDAAAQAWMRAALVEMFRSTSYRARERALWILSEEGPDGVLGEVGLMTSDHARATYLAILLDDGDLSPGYVRSVITLAGTEIESDHSLGEVLMAAADRYPFDATTRTAFLEAATSIDSDHTQGRIFSTALSREDLSQSDLELLLRTAAGSIDSDHTLGEVLTALASRYPLEPRLREPFLQAARTLESDHTAGEVYRQLLRHRGLRPDELAAVLEATAHIESDHTLGEVLRSAAENHDVTDARLLEALLRSAATIDSDHTLSETLIHVARMDGIGESGQVALLRTARGIGSDHSLAEFLIEFARHYPPRGGVRDAFLQTMEEVGSRHSRDRVQAALEGR